MISFILINTCFYGLRVNFCSAAKNARNHGGPPAALGALDAPCCLEANLMDACCEYAIALRRCLIVLSCLPARIFGVLGGFGSLALIWPPSTLEASSS